MIRSLALASVTGLAVLAIGAAVVTAADPDITPPAGTLSVNGGAEYTNTRVLDLDVPATDDVGVVEVRVGNGGNGPWTTFPYAPSLSWEHPVSTDGPLQVTVVWRDAAGNESSSQASLTLDATAPADVRLQRSDPAPPGMLAFSISANDSGSGVTHARLSSDGSTWSPPLALAGGPIDWDPFDPAAGGGPTLGKRTVRAQVRDGAGNWSASASLDVFIAAPSLSIVVSPSPRTGSSVTLTPVLPDGTAFPANAVCMWELLWGDDDSLYLGKHNETFGSVMTLGSGTKGWCGPWTFTLPWGPVPHYLVSFTADAPGGSLGHASIGADMSGPRLTAGVGTTDRRIRSSNIPVVYILPDSFDVVVGDPVTYRAYAVGGAGLGGGYWLAQAVNDQALQQQGGTAFTFEPDRPGHWTVCWGTNAESPRFSACFDPPVKRASASSPAPTAPPAAGSPSSPPTAAPGSEAPSTSSSADPSGSPDGSTPPSATPETAVVSGAPSEGASSDPGQPSSPVKSPSRSPQLPLWVPLLVVVGVVVAAVAGLWRSGRLERWRNRAR